MALLFAGCGGPEGEAPKGDWTVVKDGLTLAEDLVVSDSDNFYFGRIRDIAVRADGQMYVADGEAHHVKVLSPEGELLETIGAKGEGPGEFQRLEDIVLARNDSLFVLDDYAGRISAFSPEHEFEYSFLARDESGSPNAMMVSPTGSGFLFAFTPFSRQVALDDAKAAVRPVHADQSIGDTLFTARPYQMAWEGGPNGRMTFYALPFARSSHYALGPDGYIHHGWGDSLRIAVYNQDGERQRTVRIPFEPIPITEEDIEKALEGWSRGRALVRRNIAETKPAFTDFLMDGQGRYWFKRPTADGERADWWIADPATRRVDVFSLPRTVDLLDVMNGYAYGRTHTEVGAPALVRYRFEERF